LNIPFSSNWVATIDGINTEILGANGFEMAISLPSKGKHKLKLTYHSWPFMTGLIITLSTLAILLITGVRKTSLGKNNKLAITSAILIAVITIVVTSDRWLYQGNCLPQSYSWSSH